MGIINMAGRKNVGAVAVWDCLTVSCGLGRIRARAGPSLVKSRFKLEGCQVLYYYIIKFPLQCFYLSRVSSLGRCDMHGDTCLVLTDSQKAQKAQQAQHHTLSVNPFACILSLSPFIVTCTLRKMIHYVAISDEQPSRAPP